jgi:hypothetical protein
MLWSPARNSADSAGPRISVPMGLDTLHVGQWTLRSGPPLDAHSCERAAACLSQCWTRGATPIFGALAPRRASA